MRLFFALTFKEFDKEKICLIRDQVANYSVKGKFTRQTNFHMTMSFLGEVNEKELDFYEDALNILSTDPICLTANYIGTFKKKNRDIVWLGCDKNKALHKQVKLLNNYLKEHELEYDDRAFSPHITLGRQVILGTELSNIRFTPLKIQVQSIALMVSHRVKDLLTYEPIAEILLD